MQLLFKFKVYSHAKQTPNPRKNQLSILISAALVISMYLVLMDIHLNAIIHDLLCLAFIIL